MARRRRRRKSGGLGRYVVVLSLFGLGFVYREALLGLVTSPDVASESSPLPVLTTERPENGPLDGGPHADVPERATNPIASPDDNTGETIHAKSLLSSGRRALGSGDLVLARAHFSEALNASLPPQEEIEARAELRKLGRETIFSPTVTKDDPYSEYYTIQPGDSLQKIAKEYEVTAEFLARVNNIPNINQIRAGRRLKVVRGPFHARVTKGEHTLDIFCHNTFVDHFPVGLGAEDGTPLGKWKVKTKLKNPTYYPPRGGMIVAAGDPDNPLGERWIGLEGLEGDALGATRYGIHGTIEPDSIGKDASMGCVRMHNEDVEVVFDLLIAGKSFVEIVE